MKFYYFAFDFVHSPSYASCVNLYIHQGLQMCRTRHGGRLWLKCTSGKVVDKKRKLLCHSTFFVLVGINMYLFNVAD